MRGVKTEWLKARPTTILHDRIIVAVESDAFRYYATVPRTWSVVDVGRKFAEDSGYGGEDVTVAIDRLRYDKGVRRLFAMPPTITWERLGRVRIAAGTVTLLVD